MEERRSRVVAATIRHTLYLSLILYPRVAADGAGVAVSGAGVAVSGAGVAVSGASTFFENSTDLAMNTVNKKLIRISYANVSFLKFLSNIHDMIRLFTCELPFLTKEHRPPFLKC